MFKQQQLLKVKQQQEEQIRILDSITQAKQLMLDEGMNKLRETRAKLEKELNEQ